MKSLVKKLLRRKKLKMTRTFIDILFRKELASIRDEELVQLLYADFGPEIDHLKGVPRAVEGDGNPPNGNLTENGFSPSRLLFGEDFDEVNRTITNVRAVKWLLANEYEPFTANQPAVVKLSPETFQELRERVLPLWEDPDYLLALIVALVVGDMGKDPHLAEEIAARQGTGDKHDHENHDECLAEAVECGILDTPLSRLSDARREEVVLGINVGATLNIPQLTQGENVPGSLQPLLQFRGHHPHGEAFNLKYQEIIFDVSGAGGHLDSRGATRMIEPVCQSFLQAWPILSDVITNERSLREAYDAVLQNRGELIAEKGFPLLSPTDSSHRALLRLFAMGRVADQETAEQFQDAFQGLSDTTREALINGLNVDGIHDGDAVVLYYMPALFAETLRVLRTASSEDRVIALQSLMGFMVRTFDGSKPQPDQPGSIKERNVSPAVDLVRSSTFRDNLRLLDDYTLP
ncbi:hypothetical protein N7488_009369 [Penicillium malachiteum]|nr:hypothetical protein N7488_009369 [Penicillium malachiteum]